MQNLNKVFSILMILVFTGLISCANQKRNKSQEKFCNSEVLREISNIDKDLVGSYVCVCAAGEIKGSSVITCDSVFNSYISKEEFKTCGSDKGCSAIYQRRK